MKKRKLIGNLPPELQERWASFNKEKLTYDRWVREQVRLFEKKVKEQAKDVDKSHIEFWDAVYARLGLDPNGKYAITKEGKVYELSDEGNALFEAVGTFFDTELPPEMSDDEAFTKLVHEFGDPPDIANQMLHQRRQYYGDKIRPNGPAN